MCTATNVEDQATGVLFFGAAAGSCVASSTLDENDIGAYYDSTSATQPSSPEVTFAKDVLTSNRYEGFVLEQGKALLSNDTIDGSGDVGIDLVQSETQTAGLAVERRPHEGRGSDRSRDQGGIGQKRGGHPGSFDFTDGTFNGDGTVLVNESSDFEVVL